MTKRTSLASILVLLSVQQLASAAFVVPVISNGGFEAGGADWRLFGAGLGLPAGDPAPGEGSASINFDATNWAGGDYGFDRDSNRIPVTGTDQMLFQFAAKNNNGALAGNRIAVHFVEFAGGVLTAGDEIRYFDTGLPGTWTVSQFPYSVRNPLSDNLNIAFRYYQTSDNANFTLAAGNYNIDGVRFIVPEPATIALAAAFVAVIGATSRRRAPAA